MHQGGSVSDELITAPQESRPLGSGAPRRTPRSPSELAPVSFQQEYLWNTQRSNPCDNIPLPVSLRLAGDLNVDCLQAALQEVVRRHESLRTRICVVDGIPKQQIEEEGEYRLMQVDLRTASHDGNLNGAARSLVEQFISRPMDLAADPLFQVQLITLSDQEHVLAIAIHHIITDGSSNLLLFRELWSLYGSFVRGRPSTLPDLPLQYADYAIWQRRTHGRWLERHAGYWQKRLDRAVRIKWPVDSDVKNTGFPTVVAWPFSFGATLSSKLLDLARRERVMPAMLSVALYAALVSNWCRQRDFVIPFTIAGRDHPELNNIVGLFSQAVLMRIELSGCATFIDLLHFVTKEFAAAWQHLDCSKVIGTAPELGSTYMQWVSWTPEDMAGTRTPTDWHNCAPHLSIETFLEGYQPEGVRVEWEANLRFWNTAGDIHVYARYRTDIFTEDTMRSVSQKLVLIAENVTRDPRMCVESSGDSLVREDTNVTD